MAFDIRRRDLLASALFAGASTAHAVPQPATEATARELASRINALGECLLSAESSSGKSALISPLSVADALAILASGARGTAAAVLTKTMGPTGGDNALSLGRALGGASELQRAAAVWLPEGQTPLPSYRELVSRWGGMVEQIEFASPDALSRINGWVADRTMKMIPTFLDGLPRDPGVIVTAALHFAARWTVPFDPAATKPVAFTGLDEQRSIHQFMHATRVLLYAETASWCAVRIPYAAADYEFVALIPNAGRPAIQTLQLVQQRGIGLTLAALQFAKTEVELAMPRLNLHHSSDLLEILRQTSLGPAMAPDADYGGISNTPMRISAIRQKVVLRVDEAGTQAAAATGVLGDRGVLPRVRIALERPYLALVIHQPTGLHVVSALVSHPGSN